MRYGCDLAKIAAKAHRSHCDLVEVSPVPRLRGRLVRCIKILVAKNLPRSQQKFLMGSGVGGKGRSWWDDS